MGAEFIQGTIRTLLIAPHLGRVRAGQLGVLTGSAAILLIAFLTVGWLGIPTRISLLEVGLGWLVLTLVFEFSFGHFVFHRSWRDLGSDYDLRHGGLLTLGMIVLAAAPLLAARLRGLRSTI